MRRLAAVAAIVILGFGVSSIAGAQTEPGGNRTFGIRAALYGQTDLKDGHFAFAVPRGLSVNDAAEVVNFTGEPFTVDVYPADVTTARGGGALTPLGRRDQMRGVGKWLRLDDPSQARILVPPFGRVRVPFTLTVPADAPFGDSPGALVVSKPAMQAEGQIGIEPRVAMLVDVSVPGTAELAATVSKPTSAKRDGGYDFATTVTNTGNVLLTLDGFLELRDGGKVVAKLPIDRAGIYVIPGGRTTLTARWDDPPAFGRRMVVARVRGTVNDKLERSFVSRPASLTIVPWTLVGSTLAAATALVGISILNRRRWSAWRRRRREDREIVRRVRSRAELT